MDKTETAVLLSGGLDSSVALHWAHRNHRVRVALSFDYASNHAERELECAAWQAASLGIEHRVIDISPISAHLKSALLSGADDIPDGSYDEELMKQARDIRDAVRPNEILFVIDAMIGQDAVKTAKAFDEGVDFTGVVLSKLDGDARGGAALSVASVTGKPILFASNGEGLKDFEVFHPDRMASRILDMGDIMTLIEQAQKQFDEEEARKAAEKISEGSFGLDDFLDQLQQVRKLGSMKSLLGMIPGMAQHRKELEQFDEREIDRTEAIIRSMTPAERRDPSIINGSRRARIAYGSGVTVSQVNALLQRFEQAAKMMKRMSNRGGMGGGIPGFGGPAMGGGKKKGKNKKKGGKSGNPMKREAEEKALRDKLAGKSSGSTGGSAFAKKPQNPALPAGLEQMMGNVDGGTELPPNLGGGLGGLFGR